MNIVQDKAKRLLEAIQTKTEVQVVGINGMDCSGKTTFANAFAVVCRECGVNTTVLHVDDYNDLSVQEEVYSAYVAGTFTPALLEKYYRSSINYPALFEAIENHKRKPNSLLVVEGVFLFKPPLEDLLDYKVFLSFEPEQGRARYARRKKQVGDMRPTEVFTDIWVPVFDRYCSEFCPEKNADIVFEG